MPVPPSMNGVTYTLEKPILQVKDIHKALGGNPILREVNAEIRDIHRATAVTGQVVAFLGPSGIGKTTLFRILAGLDHPDRGEVLIGEEALPVRRGMVGVVAQSYPLFAHRTVLGNLVVAGRRTGLSRAGSEDRARAFLHRFGLEGKEKQYPIELSGGQRQRVAIAQQFMCSEHFLLMDEPFSGLDPLAKDKVVDLVTEVAGLHELNTIVVVTHDIIAGLEVADTIWLMGRERDSGGNPIPGANIRATYNLADMGLAWKKGIAGTPSSSSLRAKCARSSGSSERRPPLETPNLWKKAVAKATFASGNVVSGAAAIAASAALWNPLPLILWGLGSATWIFLASTSKEYAEKILGEERREREAREEAERAAARRRVESVLAQDPFASWIDQHDLPDYLVVYDRLVETRARIVRMAKERPEVEYIAETGISKQLGYMLSAFLEFVLARTTYLQVLSGVRAADPGTSPKTDPNWQRRLGEKERGGRRTAVPLPSVDERLAQLDQRIADVRELAKKEPATAKTREWHAQILEKQRALLVECRDRDQQVVAQLAAFPDMFEVIGGRVSASQFDEREIAQYMGGIVKEVEETSKFVQEMRPAMDEVMIQLEAGA